MISETWDQTEIIKVQPSLSFLMREEYQFWSRMIHFLAVPLAYLFNSLGLKLPHLKNWDDYLMELWELNDYAMCL